MRKDFYDLKIDDIISTSKTKNGSTAVAFWVVDDKLDIEKLKCEKISEQTPKSFGENFWSSGFYITKYTRFVFVGDKQRLPEYFV